MFYHVCLIHLTHITDKNNLPARRKKKYAKFNPSLS